MSRHMPPFKLLRALREFERRHLQYIQTLEDYDLVREIGYAQHNGQPITMRDLLALGVCSVATCQRRLQRLRRLGVLAQRRSASDGHVQELVLLPHVVKTFVSFEELIRRQAAEAL